MTLFIALISFLALMLAIFLFRKFGFGDGLTHQQRKTIEKYGFIPKAGNAKQYSIVIVIALYCILSHKATAQMFCEIGPGITNGFFSGELQAGYRHGNTVASIGYISLPNNTQPTLFNIRAGSFIAERVMVYGGYTKVFYSTDVKSKNFNTWQVGAQYHFFHYDKGTMYIGSNYSGNKMISFHLGFSYNLSQGLPCNL